MLLPDPATPITVSASSCDRKKKIDVFSKDKQMSDPRDTWTKKDWAVAIAFLGMLENKPPGEYYAGFYEYAAKHKVPLPRSIEKTVNEILKFQHRKPNAQTRCMVNKIHDLWHAIYTEKHRR